MKVGNKLLLQDKWFNNCIAKVTEIADNKVVAKILLSFDSSEIGKKIVFKKNNKKSEIYEILSTNTDYVEEKEKRIKEIKRQASLIKEIKNYYYDGLELEEVEEIAKFISDIAKKHNEKKSIKVNLKGIL